MGIGASYIFLPNRDGNKTGLNHQPGICCILLCLSALSFGKYVYFAYEKKPAMSCLAFIADSHVLWKKPAMSCLAFIADSTTSQMLPLSAITLVFFAQKMP